MDGFEEQLLNDLQLKIIVGNRQPKDNGKEKKKIDGFVLSSNLGFPENNSTDIFHPNSNPRTVQISEKIFDHNPICLKVEVPAEEANVVLKPGMEQLAI